MARIQIESHQVEASRVAKFPRTRVSRRATWSGAWEAVDYLECVSISEAVSPTGTRAEFRYQCGRIKREDRNTYDTYPPLRLEGQFLRVELLADDAPDESRPGNRREAKPPKAWYFVCTDSQGNAGGMKSASLGDDAGNQPVDQQVLAAGLEYLLDRVTIRGTWTYKTDGLFSGGWFKIDRGLYFNDDSETGLPSDGNRSQFEAVFGPDDSDRAFYIDGKPDAQSTTWSVYTALEHLLTCWSPLGVRFRCPEITPGSVADAMIDMTLPRLGVEGLTLRQAIDRLIEPTRGIGWCVRVPEAVEGETEEADPRPTIHVFAVDGDPIQLETTVLPGNAEAVELDLTADRDAVDVQFTDSGVNRYKVIRVIGSQVLSCFTVSVADGSLVPGWTTEQQARYIGGDGGTDTAEKDFNRRQESLRDVFTLYRFNYELRPDRLTAFGITIPLPGIRNGLGSGGYHNVNPRITADGKPDFSKTAASRDWGLPFERVLPIPLERDDPDDVVPRYMPPFVLVERAFPLGGENKTAWLYADRPAVPGFASADVSMLPRDAGIHIDFNPPHLLAANVAIPDTTRPAEYRYNRMLATVAFRLDSKLVVEVDTRGAGDVLTIDVPDAELWIIAADTVIGVNEDGTLKRHLGETVLRDDAPRLRQIARTAKAWYGKRRRPLTVAVRRVLLAHPPGSYLKAVVAAQGEPIELVVSARAINFAAGTTTLTCAYRELDFTGEGRR